MLLSINKIALIRLNMNRLTYSSDYTGKFKSKFLMHDFRVNETIFRWFERIACYFGLANLNNHPTETVLIQTLLKHSGITLSQDTIDQALYMEEFELSPSLGHIMRTILLLGFKAKGQQIISLNDTSLQQIKVPFITFFPSIGYAVVTKILKDSVEIYSSSSGYRRVRRSILEKDWSGVIITVSEDQVIEEPDSESAIQVERWKRLEKFIVLLIIPIVSFLMYPEINHLFIHDHMILWGGFFITSIAGLISASIMVNMYVGSGMTLMRFCKAGRKADCISVLDSKFAKLFHIPYADIGLVYFASILGFIIFKPLEINALFPIVMSSALSPLYFIFLQAFIIKKWCKICIFVHVMLIAQFFLLVWNFGLPEINHDTILTWIQAMGVLACITVVLTLIWCVLRSMIAVRTKAALFAPMQQRHVYSAANLDAAWEKAASSENLAPPPSAIRLTAGTESKASVSVVLSASCAICGELLDDIWFDFCKSGNATDYEFLILSSDVESHIVALHFYEIASEHGATKAILDLQRWFHDYFNRQDVQGWLAATPKTDGLAIEEVQAALDTAAAWSATIPGFGTPSLYLNGRAVDREYYQQFALYKNLIIRRQEDAAA